MKKLTDEELDKVLDIAREELFAIVDKAEFDLNGHDFNIEYLKNSIVSSLTVVYSWAVRGEITREDVFNKEHPIFCSFECHSCGEDLEVVILDKGKKFQIKEACKYPDGYPEIEADLEVPSGEIVLFNDLREFYDEDPDRFKSENSINHTAGKNHMTQWYAKQGLIMHFTGNSSPDVVQRGNTLIIAGGYCKGKVIGSICTDLWWYCAADREALEKRMGKTIEQYQKEYHDRGAWPELVIAKVKKGIYRSTGRYHLMNENSVIYSKITRIKDL